MQNHCNLLQGFISIVALIISSVISVYLLVIIDLLMMVFQGSPRPFLIITMQTMWSLLRKRAVQGTTINTVTVLSLYEKIPKLLPFSFCVVNAKVWNTNIHNSHSFEEHVMDLHKSFVSVHLEYEVQRNRSNLLKLISKNQRISTKGFQK